MIIYKGMGKGGEQWSDDYSSSCNGKGGEAWGADYSYNGNGKGCGDYISTSFDNAVTLGVLTAATQAMVLGVLTLA